MTIGIDFGQGTAYDSTFPQVGVDQPSQAFRDNWLVIKTAVENLQSKTITISGDVTGTTPIFDSGSATIALSLSLPVQAGVVGTYTVPSITVDDKGRITAVSEAASAFLKTDGTNSMSGNLNLNNNNLVLGTGLVDGRNISVDGAILDLINTGTGIKVQTGVGTFANRQIDGTTSQIAVSNNDGIGANPIVALAVDPILPGTGAVIVPKGTSAQQPSSPVSGMFRFNTSNSIIEYYDSATWNAVPKDIKSALVNLTADMAVTSSTDTVVTWGAAEHDTGSFFNLATQPTRLTVPTGVTRVKLTGNIGFNAITNSTSTALWVRKNGLGGSLNPGVYGLPVLRVNSDTTTGAITDELNVTSAVINVVAGDYFELWVRRGTGSTAGLTSANFRTWFAIESV